MKTKICFSICAALALCNFAEAVCANAGKITIQDDKSNSSCTLTDTADLSITDKGKLQKVDLRNIQNKNITIENSGAIVNPLDRVTQGSVDSYGIRLDNKSTNNDGAKIKIENKGLIQGKQYGINLNSSQGVTVESLQNSGDIKGENNEGIYIGSNITVDLLSNEGSIFGSQGFWITDDPTIKTFKNGGSISGKTRAIVLNKGSIGTFENKGKVLGGSQAALEVRKESKIEKLIVDGEDAEFISGVNNSYNASDNSSSKGGIHNRGDIGEIIIDNKAKVSGITNAKTNGQDGKVKSISLGNGSNVDFIENAGNITGDISIKDGSKVDTLENTGKVENVLIEGKDSKVTTLQNTGTIKDIKVADESELTTLVNKSGGNITGDIVFNKKTKIIENEGTISGILNFNESSTSFKNTGKVKAISFGNQSNVNSIENTGTITGDISIKDGSKVDTLENTGKVENVLIEGKDSKVTTLQNTGTIKDIKVADESELTALVNKSGGNITGDIVLNKKTKIIENEGTISGSLNFDESITRLKNTGVISNFTAKKEIVTLDNSSDLNLQGSGLITSSLIQGQQAKLNGVDIKFIGKGLKLENKGSIENRLFNPKNSSLSFDNEGSIEYFNNDGELTSGLNNKANATLKALVNTGVINEGINNNGQIESLENTGYIKPNANSEHIKNDDGEIKVIKWYIPSTKRIPLKSHQAYVNPSDVDSRLVITGNKSSDVDFSAATIFIDAQYYDFGVEYDIKHSILLKNSPLRPSSAQPLAISNYVDSKAFTIIYDASTGIFIINPQSQALFGAVFADFLLNYVQRRTIFVDTILEDEETKFANNVYTENKHFFFLPFVGYDDFSLSTRSADAKANTNGFVSGFYHFDEDNFYEFFWGFDKANSYININDAQGYVRADGEHKAFFGGIKHKYFLQEQGDFKLIWQNTFKFAKRSADLRLVQEKSADVQSDSVNIYGLAYGTHLELLHTGEDQDFRVKAGLGYEGFRIGSFNISVENEKQNIKLFNSAISVVYTKSWLEQLSTSLELGTKLLINNQIQTHFKNDFDSFYLPKNYTFTQASLRFALEKNLHFDLSYNGTFARNGESHNGYLSVNYQW